jgi:hypothetical protein
LTLFSFPFLLRFLLWFLCHDVFLYYLESIIQPLLVMSKQNGTVEEPPSQLLISYSLQRCGLDTSREEHAGRLDHRSTTSGTDSPPSPPSQGDP